MKTFIKWSGNKGKHLRHILPHIPEFTGRYIEPFLGSGALFLKLAPEKWIINDLNKDLVNVWKLVRDDNEFLIKEFTKFGKKFKEMTNEEKTLMCRKITLSLETLEDSDSRTVIYIY